MEKLEKLFSPGKIGNLYLKNRAVMPPMDTGFCESDGILASCGAHRPDGAGAPHPGGEVPDHVPLTDRLAEVTGQDTKETVILFTDIPLKNATLGGISHYDNPTW